MKQIKIKFDRMDLAFGTPIDLLVFLLINVVDSLSSLDVLKSNVFRIFALVIDVCLDLRTNEGLTAIERAGVTRLATNLGNYISYWDRIGTRENFLKRYYDYLLSLDGLATLPNFGFTNSFGDRCFGNPEKSSIYK